MGLEPGDLLTVAQVRKLLPLSKATITRLADQGLLQALRIRTAGSRRGRLLFSRASLEHFVAASMEEKETERDDALDATEIVQRSLAGARASRHRRVRGQVTGHQQQEGADGESEQ